RATRRSAAAPPTPSWRASVQGQTDASWPSSTACARAFPASHEAPGSIPGWRSKSMLVNEIMSHKVVAIGPDTPIKDVQALMELRNIRHFPILAEPSGGASDRLVGIVSDRDVRL